MPLFLQINYLEPAFKLTASLQAKANSQVVHKLFVPDIFALEHTNGIEEITRYFDFYR